MRQEEGMSLLVSLVAGFLVLIASSPVQGDDAKLETFIAQSIFNDHVKEPRDRSFEGCIVVHLPNVEKGPASPIKVWKYMQGNLVDAPVEDYEKAVGKDRSQWPPFAFLFKIKSATPTSATVEVDTLYNMGISPSSRGGNAQQWTLETTSGNWLVIDKRTTLFWD